jgi:hypothetical protein
MHNADDTTEKTRNSANATILGAAGIGSKKMSDGVGRTTKSGDGGVGITTKKSCGDVGNEEQRTSRALGCSCRRRQSAVCIG